MTCATIRFFQGVQLHQGNGLTPLPNYSDCSPIAYANPTSENLATAYQLQTAIDRSSQKWLIAVGSEKTVDALNNIGLAAITWKGDRWRAHLIAKDLAETEESKS